MAGGAPAMKLMAARDGMWSAVFSSIGQLAAPFVPLGVLFIMLALAMLFAARMVRGQFRHRGEMHSFTLAGAGAIMGLLVCAVFHLAAWVGLAFGFGWAMHLVADATTPAGLEEPLWPFDVAGVALGRGPAAVSLALVVVLGLAGWVHVSGAMLDARAPRAASVPTRVVGNVPLARQRLAEASPEIEASLASPDAPTIGVVGSNTTYTWDRLQQTTAGAVTVRKITLTLDSAGNIVGVDQR